MEGLTSAREAQVKHLLSASPHQLSRRSFLAGLGLAAGGLALAACGVAPATGDAARGELELLAILDLTGPLAPLGRQMAAGAALAVADIKKSGGVLDRPVSLAVLDSRSDPREFERFAAVTEREGRHTAVLMGPLGQVPRDARLTYLRAGPDLGAPSTQRELRAASSLATQVTLLGKYARDKSASKVHLVIPAVPWLDTSRLGLAVGASSGLIVAGTSRVSLEQVSFAAAIDEMGRSGADCALCLVPGVPQLALLEQLRTSALHGRVLVLAPAFGASGEQVVAGPLGAGVVTAAPYLADMPGSDAMWATDVATRLKTTNSRAAGDAAASAWLACKAWAALAHQARSVEVLAHRGAAATIPAPEGTATVDTSLQRVRRTVVVGVADGKGDFAVQPAYSADDSVPASAAPGARS